MPLKHKNLIQYLDAFSHDGIHYTVLEYANKHDLGHAIFSQKKKDNLWKDSHVAYLTVEIAEGLKFLHDQNILHRDLKPQNILLHRPPQANDIQVKITDFGLSREIGASKDYVRTECGTRLYMAPECHGGKYFFPSDIWALGCVLFEIGYSLQIKLQYV